MINLLPYEQKREIEAARMNTILLSYNFLTLIALGLMVAVCVLFYLILNNAQSNASNISSDSVKKAASYENVKRDADDYRENLSLAKLILDKSVNYTSVIMTITKLLPDGVVLDAIELNAANFGQQTTFTGHAKTYAQATELKANFQKSSMFSNVFLQSLTDDNNSGGSATSSYPILITISANLKKVDS